MNRRTLLKSARAVGALAVVGLARPAISQRAASRAVRLVPHADLANFDPVWTTAYIARNAGLLVWDTLYGVNNTLNRTLLLCRAAWRTAMSPFDAVSRRSVRAAAVSPPFPLGGVLPSTASAEGKPSLFGRFSGTASPMYDMQKHGRPTDLETQLRRICDYVLRLGVHRSRFWNKMPTVSTWERGRAKR
jgi:hypothetical protein